MPRPKNNRAYWTDARSGSTADRSNVPPTVDRPAQGGANIIRREPQKLLDIHWEFDYFFECRVVDPGQKFLYLKPYCRGKARDATEECVMLRS
ncbi:unnamed protein product [Echinostoma caproni]|uniref:Transposase n=1 Tax=Echinostoma caproni TaxID=27848 RepID=A0A183BF21_9TREM|nr:unnamed protein product [Echinostoma caproni]